MLTNRKNCGPHCQPGLVHLGKIAFGIASWGRNVDTPQSPTGGFTLTCWKRMLGHLIIQSAMDFRKNHLPMHNEKKSLATLSVLRLRNNITFENASKSSIISLTPYILEMIMIKLLKNQHEPSPLWMCNLCKVDTLTKEHDLKLWSIRDVLCPGVHQICYDFSSFLSSLLDPLGTQGCQEKIRLLCCLCSKGVGGRNGRATTSFWHTLELGFFNKAPTGQENL